MEHPVLRGRSILVIENELLIAMDILQALEQAGANATMTTTARHALTPDGTTPDTSCSRRMLLRGATGLRVRIAISMPNIILER
jgi:hypothetical protein